MSTVGYGDISCTTGIGRKFQILFLLIGLVRLVCKIPKKCSKIIANYKNILALKTGLWKRLMRNSHKVIPTQVSIVVLRIQIVTSIKIYKVMLTYFANLTFLEYLGV